jgi:hypothetical protein
MIDNPVDNGIPCDESDDLHLTIVIGADHRSKKGTRTEFRRIRNMSPPELSHPAFGRNALQVLIGHPEGRRTQTRLYPRIEIPDCSAVLGLRLIGRRMAGVNESGQDLV